ncbi:anti-sigma factor [Roseivivax halodurans]|uniref:anti-sigma factor n=1 Tax=Roseivivax halodurans TaxID=93683 RepID=UPI0004B3B81E|nr:anti-sigma factor [Roseivivax halodurans]
MTDRSLDILIDEVVLGLASEADVARLEALAAQDPDVAARVEQARRRFAPLDDTAEELPVPAGLWDRIARALDAPQDDAARPARDNTVVDLATMRRHLNRWRVGASAAIAASLVLAGLLGWTMTRSVDPLVVAVLQDESGAVIALVESNADNTTSVTLLERPGVPPDQVMQVWTKPDDDGLPVSLGLLPTARSSVLMVDGLPAPHSDQLYEITFEPAGGSPTNLPTGPILGKGLAKEPVS